MRERLDALFLRLADFQARRPSLAIAAVLALSIASALLALRLELRTRFDQLLPENQPSVVALRKVEARTISTQTAMILLEGGDVMERRALGDAMVVELASLGPAVVASAEDGVQTARDFLRPRAGFFLEPKQIDQLSIDLDAEIARQMGTSLDDTRPFDPSVIEKTLDRGERFPDGYYANADALVVVARSPVPLGDIDGACAAVSKMKSAVERAGTRPGVRVTFTGDMIAGLEEYSAVERDLFRVGGIGLGLVLGVVLLYFMRIRALAVMAATIACGLACTFGLTELAIGHLNVATGFLFSIIAGNGINVGILYLSRYYEEKREGASTAEAIRTAHAATWPSTSIAALASAAAYASLAVTQFRTFEQFAFIGGAGMLACWAVTIVLLPALLVVFDGGTPARGGLQYGRLFAAIVPKAPRVILFVSIAIMLVGAAAAERYVARDPMEYDLTRVQNDRARSAELVRAWSIATSIVGRFADATIILADDASEAREAASLLRTRSDSVHTLFDYVPPDQTEKLPALLALSSRLRSAHDRRVIRDEDWSRIGPLLPPPDAKPFGVADLPEALARPYTEKNGTRGTIILALPSATDDTNDLHDLLRYAAAFRDVPLANGKVLHGAGRALVFADILDAVVTRVPRALALSLALTIAVVLVGIRRRAHAVSVLAALAVGFASVGAFLYFAHERLNFLNFIALPITFGIGVDYAVNVMQRYEADDSRDILGALRTTGGAVVLCSLTTMLGYVALLGSHNQAIRSLGTIAVVGEISCLLAAVVAMPALHVDRITRSR